MVRNNHKTHTDLKRTIPALMRRFRISPACEIAIDEFDVHYDAIACGVTEGTLVKVIDTSKRRGIPRLVSSLCDLSDPYG